MRKLELNQMESLIGGAQQKLKNFDEVGGNCTQTVHRGDFSRSDACIICSGLGGMAGGAIFGGGAGALGGWVVGIVNGMFNC